MENNNITLRDYFAGLAMQAFIAYYNNGYKEVEVFNNLSKSFICDESYLFADKMLEARDK